MQFKQEGEWVVSTPLLAGLGPDVEKARSCAHPAWCEETRAVEHGKLMVMERCRDCRSATRVKYRDATDQELGGHGCPQAQGEPGPRGPAGERR